MTSRVVVVGAGLSGSVIARQLAEASIPVTILDERRHLGGNCYTERDPQTGVMIHKYGPHIFHTDDDEVWDFVNKYTRFMPYKNQVKANFMGRIYSLPINLHTINQLFGSSMSPDEARSFIDQMAVKTINEPKNFEEQALKFVGHEIYNAFLKGYTIKQWGVHPTALPSSILKRLPVRFDYNDNYFSHKLQGIPEFGYAPLFENMLDHKNIEVSLNTRVNASDLNSFAHVFWSGTLDGWFMNDLGDLQYRTLDFEQFMHHGTCQGCAVMNYSDEDIPWTRITEHKYFAPWESHSDSLLYREFSRECMQGDIPYYPLRLSGGEKLLEEYMKRARDLDRVTFIGRLGTYRYLDMDISIKEALYAARQFIKCKALGDKVPPFIV